MAIHDLLLQELEGEAVRTRATLERVPADKADWAPHAKSMKLGKLAAHVAQLGGFGVAMLTKPELDFATAGMKPLVFESPAQSVAAYEQGVAAVKAELRKLPDEAWTQPWALRMGDTVFFSGNRFNAYRAMYLNHMVHHRAQLGVYLRLLGVAVPSVYGPSADEAA
jgi:uncharacterized damage-inducible protein DinB